jgi:hypothetical protein
MIIQTIDRLAQAAFRCEWEDITDSRLKLNFDVIIKHFDLSGQFCLMHWQAKPKFLRRWGIYDSVSDRYHSSEHDQIRFSEGLSMQTLQLDEALVSTVPTAVIYYPGAKAILSDDGLINIVSK